MNEHKITVKTFSTFGNLIKDLPSPIDSVCDPNNDKIAYLDDYLRTIRCQTVVIEDCYVDKNFLEDYARYYSRCFQEYPKKCVRVHFFAAKFGIRRLKNYLNRPLHSNKGLFYDGSYLGFIVFRPLPNAPLAKVCLTTYRDEIGKHRHFPVLKDYFVHFLGSELSVKSLAFQEQDRALSACATSALWSAFHGSSGLDVNTVSAPSRITENAKKIIPQATSNHPHRGLTPAQMSNSIREEGLEPLLCNFINTSYLKALLRAYLSVGVAPVLGMTLYYGDEQGVLANGIPRTIPIGDHAVAVAGYNMSENQPKEFKADDIGTNIPVILRQPMYLLSSSIDKLYVHDDEVGPFVKMEFDDEYWQHLKTRWHMYRKNPDEINATVRDILLPKPHKIRISFNTIFSIIREFNSLYMGGWYDDGGRVVWDIYLTTVNDFKQEIRSYDTNYFLQPQHKMSLLSLSLPRYIWRVDGYMLEKSDQKMTKKSFTYIFDATEIENSDLFVCAVHYDLFSRIDIFLSVLNPLLTPQLNTVSKFSQSYRIAEEYFDLKSNRILY